MTRSLAELSVETHIDPIRLAELGPIWVETLIDVVNERNKGG